MDSRGLPSHSSSDPNINAQESRILGRSQEQKGTKRKNDGEDAKGFKKMKKGLKQDLMNRATEISKLDSIISDQENFMDNFLHLLVLEYEELELLKEELAASCPDTNWDVWMSEIKKPFDIIFILKHRSNMLEKIIQLLYEKKFK